MRLSETFTTADDVKKAEHYDVRKEAERMVRRFDRQIQQLRDHMTGAGQELFQEALIKATEQFKEQLKTFLSQHGAENLYQEMVGFVSGKVAEVVNAKAETKN
ncbi:MAG: hypothetical protein Q8P95_00400 [bacterium]|nr:hypothetical protein [bacterium]